jgi:uncharacterized protein (TIGR03085 family)
MTHHAQHERAALCDLLDAVGPDQPTLCEGWDTRDLAAHLVVRERRPDAALGILAPPFARHGERVREGVAEGRPWPELVETVRHGPPRWSPMGVLPAIDEAANTMEMYIHHEDVRRGADGWEPRALDADLDDRLWALTSRMAKMLMRKAPSGVALVRDDGTRAVVRKGEPVVEVRGPAGELALFAYGRQAHARVELVGPEDAVEALRTASFGI